MTKIAIVHDYLTQTGGAERVALSLAETFPEAPIFTSVYDPESTFEEFKGRDIRTSFLQKHSEGRDFRKMALLFGRAFANFDLSEFDKVIVSTSGFAHHIKHPNAFIYCHTPPHFIYDLPNYMSDPWKRRAVNAAVPLLRIPDQRAARRHSNYVANSNQTVSKIKEVYGKDVNVIYPPFNTSHLPLATSPLPTKARALVVGRLMPYKGFDVAIKACERADVPLTIVGAGPDEQRLRSLRGATTTFAGRLPDDEVAALFPKHSVVLMPGVEDFGFAPLDANYAGRPAIGINEGGAKETIRSGENGLLVDGDNIAAWADAIKLATTMTWDPKALREGTEPFQLAAFQQQVRAWVGES